MNTILRKYQSDNKKIISKYMTKDKTYSPEIRKIKSIIRSNLENDEIIEDSKHKTEEKDQKQKYDQGIIKRNRIKCYRELNPDLLKEEERKRRNLLIEQRLKAKKKINVKKLEKFFKRNEQELLENIKKLEQKKLIPVNDPEGESINEISKDKNNKKNLPYNVKQLHIYGNNFSNNIQENSINKYLFTYHKKDRWICFPYSDCIIVDKFIQEENNNENNDLIKNQTILNQHKNKSYIYSIKISPHGSVVYFVNEEKYIIFYKYDYQKKKFDYISEFLINYENKICDYIIEQNEIFCLVLYDNSELLVIDFFSNEEVLKTKIDYLEQNIFYEMVLNNFTEYKVEFCFCSNNSYKIYNLQYIDDIKINETRHYMKFNEDKKIKSLEFLPAMGLTATLCLLISFEDRSVLLVNADLNEIIHEYKFPDFIVNKIICGLFFINLISEKKIVFYPLSNTKNISLNDMKELKHDIFNENIKKEIKHDNKIIYTELDIYDSTGRALLVTERGFLYYDFYPEKTKIKLYGFNSEEKYINNCVLINNFSTNINEIKKLSHYIITSHKGGTIKISSIPSFDLIYEFTEKNVEITYMIGVPGKSLFIAFYNNGFMKCFDIKRCQFTGIINITDIVGYEENNINIIKYAKFYEGGKVCLIVDEAKNNLYLLTFESFDPLTVKCKQIPYINIKGLESIYINRVEPFYTFAVCNHYGEVFVYERKYAALIQTLNLENDTPIYERKDYINMDKINLAEFKLEENKISLLQNIEKINQNEIYYGLRIRDIEKEKHYLYIFNYRNNALFVRDTKNKIFVDAIQLNLPIYSIKFEKNIQDNIIIMDKNGIQHIKISDLTYGKIKYRGIEWLPGMKVNKNSDDKNYKNENKIYLSDEEKLILITNHNGYGVYLITES